MSNPDRRDFIKTSLAMALVPAVPHSSRMSSDSESTLEPEASQPAEFFKGFKREKIKTSGATINAVYGGKGSPVLLLHGIPETHVLWRKVAPLLGQDHFLVMTDLRGYGDSSKPPGGADHFAYSKRAMAQDQVEVMKYLGFDKFALVGHDRGGRAAHRMALDHPEVLTKLAILDIVPTYTLYQHITKEFAVDRDFARYFRQRQVVAITLGDDVALDLVGGKVATICREVHLYRALDDAKVHIAVT